jgi:23S rRNA (uracil1939-C5)-methyltransferase
MEHSGRRSTCALPVRQLLCVLLVVAVSLSSLYSPVSAFLPRQIQTRHSLSSRHDSNSLSAALHAHASSEEGNSGSTKTKKSKSKLKSKKTKPNSKRGGTRANSNGGARRSPPTRPVNGPRPLLTDYEANRNNIVNTERLKDKITCEHFGECPGCVVESSVASVDIVQSAKLYFSSTSIRRKRMDVVEEGLEWAVEEKDDGFYQTVVPSKVTEWRTQAKLAVAPKSSGWAKDGCSFGLFQRGTHSVLSIPECAVHHPSINRAVHALVEATSRVGTSAFQQDNRDGGLRYVQFQVERITGKVCLTLIWNAATLKETQPALSRVMKELNKQEPDLWHSIWCHCNDGIGNNIFSRNAKRWHRMSGPEFVREPLPVGDQGWLYFSPLAFRQGNMEGFDILANDVARIVPGGSQVCELYAGVGMLGLTTLAYHSQEGQKPLSWIRCSDENPNNPRCFTRAVESLPVEVTGRTKGSKYKRYDNNDNDDDDDDDGPSMTLADLAKQIESEPGMPEAETKRSGDKTSYMVASAAKALRAGQALGAQVLIVDPPRKGLEDEVIEELIKPFDPDQPYAESPTYLTRSDDKVNWTNDVQTLIYVSCGFDALARDCEKLLNSRAGWMLESATGYVLFPGSDHVETLCVFQRR